jgi:hypothetical protein
MKWIAMAFLLPAIPMAAQDSVPADRLAVEKAPRPPVLRNAEVDDNIVLTLPGVPPAAIPATPAQPVAPQPVPANPPFIAKPAEPAPVEGDHRPLVRRTPRAVLPPEFQRDAAAFSQKLIGAWTEPDAYNLFGEPLRQRPAFGDDGVENGRIVAYSDPTGHYRQVELDFDKDSGTLRSVFVYPWRMTWEQCRRQWGGNVQATSANKGRKFYSYVDRRLDVLVDPVGNVISLGLY